MPGVIAIVTVSAVEVCTPSLTVKLNTKEAFEETTCGAVNVGDAAVVELKVTVRPPVWVHAYVKPTPSGSVPEPDNVTVAPSATEDWSVPALAVGASLVPGVIDTDTVSAAELLDPAVTIKLNWRVAFEVTTCGAVNVGEAAVVELKVTVRPPVWVHAYESVSPSGSEPEPDSVTVAPSATEDWSAPAFAVGA